MGDIPQMMCCPDNIVHGLNFDFEIWVIQVSFIVFVVVLIVCPIKVSVVAILIFFVLCVCSVLFVDIVLVVLFVMIVIVLWSRTKLGLGHKELWSVTMGIALVVITAVGWIIPVEGQAGP